MKLFNITDETFTDEALSIDNEIYQAIKPILEKAIMNGAVIREVTHLANLTVTEIGLEMLLTAREKKSRESKETE